MQILSSRELNFAILVVLSLVQIDMKFLNQSEIFCDKWFAKFTEIKPPQNIPRIQYFRFEQKTTKFKKKKKKKEEVALSWNKSPLHSVHWCLFCQCCMLVTAFHFHRLCTLKVHTRKERWLIPRLGRRSKF